METRPAHPPPPHFYRRYADGVEAGPPPPRPIEGQFRQYGTLYDTEDGIPGVAAEALFGTTLDGTVGIKERLKAINREILFAFIEVVDAMATAPDDAPNRIEDLRTLVLNLGYLTNLLRPYQARASLDETLREDVKRALALQTQAEECVSAALDGLAAAAAPVEGGTTMDVDDP